MSIFPGYFPRQCLDGFTQSPWPTELANNRLIWSLCLKHKNHGLTTVKIAVAIAVGINNDGAVTYAAMSERLGLSVGASTKHYISTVDVAWVKMQETGPIVYPKNKSCSEEGNTC